MKILMVNKFLYPHGGSETYIFRLGESLVAQGHQVEYFGMQDERNVVGNTAGQFVSNMDFHKSSLQKLTYPFKIIYSRESRAKFKKVLQAFRPDIVHTNNINFQLTPSILYEAHAQNVPVVATAHDWQMVCPNHLLYCPTIPGPCEQCLNGKYRYCVKRRCIHGSTLKSLLGATEARLYRSLKTYRLFSKVICPSKFLEEKLLTNPVFKGKTAVLPNFVDMPPAPKASLGEYALFLGRYAPEKGTDLLLQVCRKLPDIPFVFAGSGPMEVQLEGISNVKNAGFVSGDALQELLTNARFLVYPSTWNENCPFSIMEAQRRGTPSIGANLGGIPELIDEGKTGLLFPRGDADALQEAVRQLWDAPESAQQMGENCLQSRWDTTQSYCEKLLKIYEEARAGKRLSKEMA